MIRSFGFSSLSVFLCLQQLFLWFRDAEARVQNLFFTVPQLQACIWEQRDCSL